MGLLSLLAGIWVVWPNVGTLAEDLAVKGSSVMRQSARPADSIPDAVTFINDRGISRSLLLEGQRLLRQGDAIDRAEWLANLEKLPTSVSGATVSGATAQVASSADPRPRVRMMRPNLDSPQLSFDHESDPSWPLRSAFDSTVIIGSLYQCEKCSHDHLSVAGGVVISDDGLVLTNHHVLRTDNPVTMVARDRQGRTFPVTEFVAGNAVDDVALIRIEGEGFPFVRLAPSAPFPASRVLTIAHPNRRFFHATWGNIARYSEEYDRSFESNRRWMEITNPFTLGASGCGVFDENGRLAGLISTLRHAGDESKESKATDQAFFKCVPLASIMDLLDRDGS